MFNLFQRDANITYTLDEIAVSRSSIALRGWAFSNDAKIKTIDVYIGRKRLGRLHYGTPRPDVAGHFEDEDKLLSGFSGVLDISQFSKKEHTVRVQIRDNAGQAIWIERPVDLDTPIRMNIDEPGQVVQHPIINVRGWAVALAGSITRMDVMIDDMILGELVYGTPRPDVAAHFDDDSLVNCEFIGDIDVKPVGMGEKELVIRAHTDDGHVSEIRKKIIINQQMIFTQIDTPQPDQILHSTTFIMKGWAFSRKGKIASIEVFWQDKSIGFLEGRHIRPDVSELMRHPRSLESGFSGYVSIPNRPGVYDITMVVTDIHGHVASTDVHFTLAEGATNELPLDQQLETSQMLEVFQMRLDSPQPHAYVYPSLRVKGWVYSSHSPIRQILVDFYGQVKKVPVQNLPRPDVAKSLQNPDAVNTGFDVTLDFGNFGQNDLQPMTITAINQEGRQISQQVNVNVLMLHGSGIEVSRVKMTDSVLDIEGWLHWKNSTPPYRVNFFINDQQLASCHANLNREDIAQEFDATMRPNIKGYRMKRRLLLPEGAGKNLEIKIQVIDSNWTGVQRIINVEHEQQAGVDLQSQVERLVAERTSMVNHEVSIMDYNTGLKLRDIFPDLLLFKPLPGYTQELPYLDGMADIVICRDGADYNMAEAERVADYAVVNVKGDTIDVRKLSGTGDGSGLPSVSIIIPVYNKKEYTAACLRSLKRNLPENFNGEVIVVDDLSNDGTDIMLQEMMQNMPYLKTIRNEVNQGFILNCNNAAQAATSEYILFLNNDMVTYPGWLEPILNTFKMYPDAGVVGGKMVFPDGTLQEAGGHIFNDATGYNFGQDDILPDYPLYSFVREVDYVSGALLATPRQLFIDLGMFDTYFKPAYYEDTDYCFQVQKNGYKVYYNPRSVVMHHRHTSYSMDSYKDTNSKKFLERWQEFLSTKPSRPSEFTREVLHRLVSPKKRVLFFAWLLPKFDETGGLLRPYIIVDQLLQMGWSVSYYSRDVTGDERYVRMLQDMGVAVYAGPRSIESGDAYHDDPEELIAEGQFDLVIVSLWQTATEIMPTIREHSPNTKVIIDSSDLYFQRMSRDAAVNGYQLDENYGREMVEEINIYAESDATLAVSVPETDMVNDLTGRQDTAMFVPNTTNIEFIDVPFEERSGVVIVGSYHYPPNADSVRFLLREIVPYVDPNILRENPIHIVGINLPDDIREMAQSMESVKAVGWVPAMEPFMRHMRLNVASLQLGSGTKRKVINPMFSGLPVVTTSIGAEGLDIVNGQHAMITDDPLQFAKYMEQVLTDRDLWMKLSREAREFIAGQLGYEVGIRYLGDAIDKVLDA